MSTPTRTNHQVEMGRRQRTREHTLNNLSQELNLRTAMQSGVGDAGGGGAINPIEIDPETGELIEPKRFWRVGDKVASHPVK